MAIQRKGAGQNELKWGSEKYVISHKTPNTMCRIEWGEKYEEQHLALLKIQITAIVP